MESNKIDVKVMVTRMPDEAKECPFAMYVRMTSKHMCKFQEGSMYSRCNLECDMECGYLIAPFTYGDYYDEEEDVYGK